MMSWPASGDATRVWAINPDAWGNDTLLVGGPFQPILFAGQYNDTETVSVYGSGTDFAKLHRPGVVLNGFRTYDPWTGSYLQVDPLVDSTWSSYLFADSRPVRQTPAVLIDEIDQPVSKWVHIPPGHIRRPPSPNAGTRRVAHDGVRRSARTRPQLGRS
jgi:hypothetical protein